MSLQVRIYTNYELQQSKNLSGAIPSGAGHFENPCGAVPSLGRLCFIFFFLPDLKRKRYQCKMWV